MIDFKSILDSLEKFAYDVLLWIILAPKTLVKIIIDPDWAPDYVAKELGKDTTERFDDYMSPIILLLVASLVSYTLYNSIPLPGVSITGPRKGIINTAYEFAADADFVWISGEIKYTFEWEAEAAEKPGQVQTRSSTKTTDGEDKVNEIAQFSWNTPGTKLVKVRASNDKGEIYFREHRIDITDPALFNEKNQVTTEPAVDSLPTQGQQKSLADFFQALRGDTSVITALIFLSIPLLFTLSVEGFRGKPITRRSLERMFYVQCYYFSPVNLSIWSSLTVRLFLGNSRIDSFLDGTLEVLFWATLIWFITTETSTIARERGIATLSAFILVSIMFFIPTFLVLDVFVFRDFTDYFRYLVKSVLVVGLIIFLVLGVVRQITNRLRAYSGATDDG